MSHQKLCMAFPRVGPAGQGDPERRQPGGVLDRPQLLPHLPDGFPDPLGEQELLEYLGRVQQGPIADGGSLEAILARCWEEFRGSDAEGMRADKLHGRMEDIVWEQPIGRVQR